jgi:hypothetical protein
VFVVFVNRQAELAVLEAWFDRPQSRVATITGRRRVGKTALAQRFASNRRVVFHVGAGRSMAGELAALSRQCAALLSDSRDLVIGPFLDWADAVTCLEKLSGQEKLLVVLDDFDALLDSNPQLPNVIRGFFRSIGADTKLRLLLCGPSTAIAGLAAPKKPLAGLMDLVVQVEPFTPAEVSRMLPQLAPTDRAVVYGLLGGTPLYLSWWDQRASLKQNIRRLVCEPGARLLTEGDLVLARDVDGGVLPSALLHAIGSGATRHAQLSEQVQTEPMRALDQLIDRGLIERVVPVTKPVGTRRRVYRITDNFLAFYLGVVDRHRSEIERGLGDTILSTLTRDLTYHLTQAFAQAFRDHLAAQAEARRLGAKAETVGPWWRENPDLHIDAVGVSRGSRRRPVILGESAWSTVLDARRALVELEAKAVWLVDDSSVVRYALCARERITHAPPDVLAVTAADIFSVRGAD